MKNNFSFRLASFVTIALIPLFAFACPDPDCVPGLTITLEQSMQGGCDYLVYAEDLIARPVVNRVKQAEPDTFGSDCPMAGRLIADGLDETNPANAEHPVSMVRRAYGV